MAEIPLVSICCITYNHEKYICEAIEGFLMQETDFSIEIIIHDDASADRTQDIIREYAENDKRIIPILRESNMKSTGVHVFPFTYEKARGKYIALCEGDDYWTDPQKLQKQVEFMEENEDYALCFHATKIIDTKTNNTLRIHKSKKTDCTVEIEELIMGGGAFVGTQTMLFRTGILKNIPAFFYDSPAGDYPLTLLAGHHGKCYYLNDQMAAYRAYNQDSAMGYVWEDDFDTYLKRYGKFAKMLHQFNDYTSKSYNKVIRKKASDLVFTAYRRKRLEANYINRLWNLKKWFNYLIIKHKILGLILTLPIPATKNQFKQLTGIG